MHSETTVSHSGSRPRWVAGVLKKWCLNSGSWVKSPFSHSLVAGMDLNALELPMADKTPQPSKKRVCLRHCALVPAFVFCAHSYRWDGVIRNIGAGVIIQAVFNNRVTRVRSGFHFPGNRKNVICSFLGSPGQFPTGWCDLLASGASEV